MQSSIDSAGWIQRRELAGAVAEAGRRPVAGPFLRRQPSPVAGSRRASGRAPPGEPGRLRGAMTPPRRLVSKLVSISFTWVSHPHRMNRRHALWTCRGRGQGLPTSAPLASSIYFDPSSLKPKRNVQQNEPRTIAHMPSRREQLPVTLARLGRPCRKLSMTGWRGGSLTTSVPVPGSPTPRELAVADGSVRNYRIGPWSLWGIRCKNRPARRQSGRQKSAKQSQLNSATKHSPSKS